jgi:Leucine-rich repeat (LRR) protein
MVRLCPDVSMMNHLREINLAGNNITNLPKALSELQQLTVSDLLLHVDVHLMRHATLTKQFLDLSDNNISLLSDDFGELRALEKLNLCGNQIYQLPTCFTKVKTLKHLDLSKNCLVHMAMLPRHLTVSTNVNVRPQSSIS